MKPFPVKKILVLFDFSDCAKNALEYAINLAEDMGSIVHVLHVFSDVNQKGLSSQYDKPLLEIKENLASEMEKLIHHLLKGRSIEISSHIKMGNLVTEVQQFSTVMHSDLILMGTYSKNPLKRLVIGSSTIEVMQNVNLPVWVIPPHFIYNGIRQVCFTTNYHTGSIPSIHQLQEMLNGFEPHISLLHFSTGKNEQSRLANFTKLLEEDIRLKNTELKDITASSLLEGVWQYTLNNEVDLMVMANKKRHGLASLFNTSSQQEAIYTKVPLLIMPRSKMVIDMGLEYSELL